MARRLWPPPPPARTSWRFAMWTSRTLEAAAQKYPEGHQVQGFPQDARRRRQEHRRRDDRHAGSSAHAHRAASPCSMASTSIARSRSRAPSWEAKLLARRGRKYNVATQMGNQGFNDEGTKTACEILWSGDIGDVKEVHGLDRRHLRRTAQHPGKWPGNAAGSRHARLGAVARSLYRPRLSIR